MAGHEVATTASPSSSRQTPPLLSGRYRSLFLIGRGGMGSVEAALEIEPLASSRTTTVEPDARGFERIVALKRLLPEAARDKRQVEMFLREARLAAMLDHPNIVRAYDYGEIDGELYLAMEYVEGQPLSRVLRALERAEQQLPPRLVAYILAEVCRGLHAAHELVDPKSGLALQLVHRDVSPQNVMIGYDGRVSLLDFGIAKIEAENVTKTGEVKGKTAYMSPEQAMGEPLDRRSDLFGVGAILFECLALRRMWGDGTEMEVIRKLALEPPPRLEETGASLPAGMSELHARLVARSAKDRPATALAVADELLGFVDDAETAAHDLRATLARHFDEQAREQRARLTSSLHEVAPQQADALRESMLPGGATTPARPRKAVSDEAHVTTAPAGPSTRSAPRRQMLLLATAAGVLATTSAWWWSSKEPTRPAPSAEAMPSAPSSVVPSGTTTASVTAGVTATASVTATAKATTTTATTKPPPPIGAGRSTKTATPAETSSVRAPIAPPTKPPDVDDHPF